MYGIVDWMSAPCWCGGSITPDQEGTQWQIHGLNMNSSVLGIRLGFLLDPDFLSAKLHLKNQRQQRSDSQQWPFGAAEHHLHRLNEWQFWLVKHKLVLLFSVLVCFQIKLKIKEAHLMHSQDV